MMKTARDHMGLRGRQKIKGRNKLRVLFSDGTRSEPLPIHEHPSALMIPRMPVPTVYFKKHETEDLPPAVQISVTPTRFMVSVSTKLNSFLPLKNP
jgi:hypothetical protein